MADVKEIKSIYEGVYSSFEEAEFDGDIWNSSEWILKEQKNILRLAESLKKDDLLNHSFPAYDYPLATIVAMLLDNKDKLSVLDWGGNMGNQYFDVLAKVPDAKTKLFFHIVESEPTIKNIPQELKDFSNLSFGLPDSVKNKKFDIVHLGSVLQYIDNWKEFINNLCLNFSADYLIISDLLGGDIPTFVSRQNFYNEKIPVRFYNVNDVINEACQHNMKLIIKTVYSPKLPNWLYGYDYYPNFALPQTHQVKSAVNLVFKRNNNG